MASAAASALMRTLSDPTRMAIFEHIVRRREATVVELTRHCRVSQPAVSQHLKALSDARLVAGRREGRNTFYRAQERGLKPLADWMQQYERFWQQSFDRLDDYLHELQRNENQR